MYDTHRNAEQNLKLAERVSELRQKLEEDGATRLDVIDVGITILMMSVKTAPDNLRGRLRNEIFARLEHVMDFIEGLPNDYNHTH